MSENTVTLHERSFELGEPTTAQVIQILNVVGSLAVRSEGAAKRLMVNPSNRSVLFGLLAVMSEADLIKLGGTVLQFEDVKEGRKWLREKGIKVAPLIQALFINIKESQDLVDAMGSFIEGFEQVQETFETLGDMFQTETEDDESDEEEKDSDQPAG